MKSIQWYKNISIVEKQDGSFDVKLSWWNFDFKFRDQKIVRGLLTEQDAKDVIDEHLKTIEENKKARQ